MDVARAAHLRKIIISIAPFAAAIFVCSLFLRIGIPVQLGEAARYSYSSFLVAVAITLYIAYKQRNWFGEILSCTLTLGLFCLPLMRLWHTGASEGYLLGGLIPWSDANDYYRAACNLIDGNIINVERPLFSGLLAILLRIFGMNLQITVAALVLVVGISVFFAAREVQENYGTWPAVLTTCSLFLFFRPFSGETMSENLGFPLGILAFLTILRGARQEKVWFVVAGLFLMTMALVVRPGAMLVLPALLLWACIRLPNKNHFSLKKTVLATTIAILLPFLFNLTFYRLKVSEESASPFSSYSYHLYALLKQKHWYTVLEEHPELKQLSSRERGDAITRLSTEILREHPLQLFSGVLYSLKQFLFGENSPFVTEDVNIKGGDPKKFIDPSLKLLCLMGLIGCLFSFRDRTSSLLFFSSLSIVLSAALVPTWDLGSRTYAVTIIIFSILSARGLAIFIQKITFVLSKILQKLSIHGPVLRKLSWTISLAGIFSFPFWYKCFDDVKRPVELQLGAPGAEYVRIYWKDPVQNPEAYTAFAVNEKPSIHWNITLDNLGKKNPHGKGSEVWLTEVLTPEGNLDLTKGTWKGSPWSHPTVRGFTWATATSGRPQSLHLEGNGGELTVRILSHPWSGLAQLRVNNQLLRMDLYGATSKVLEFKFPPIVTGDATIRTYKVFIPALFREKIEMLPDHGLANVRRVSTNGLDAKKVGNAFLLPYEWKTQFSISLIATLLTIACLFSATRRMRNKKNLESENLVINPSSSPYPKAGLFLALLLSFLCFPASLLMHFVSSYPTDKSNFKCPANLEQQYFRINPGSTIQLVTDDETGETRLPKIRLSDFRKGLISFAPWLKEEPRYFAKLPAGTSILDSFSHPWLMVEKRIDPRIKGPVVACGNTQEIGEVEIFHAALIKQIR